ncbi:MAG: acetylglutamate kinase [Dehalococcoidia bacterium]|nr:acetylglutamate kinase [Dehalococcoidia bacterium]
MKGTLVIKIGGSTFGSGDTLIEDLVLLQKRGIPLVVVHGGGAVDTDWLKKMGVTTKFVHGLRVTDPEALKVVVAVLAGLANKDLVAAIELAGGRVIGLSGVDAGLLRARGADPELGLVGEVAHVEVTVLKDLLDMGYMTLLAPVSLNMEGKVGESMILNVNGDTAAGEIAASIDAERLIFLTDVTGVCDGSGKLISRLTPLESEALIASGVISGGMEPKIRACLRALKSVKSARIIDGRQPHALLNELDGGGQGTTVSL